MKALVEPACPAVCLLKFKVSASTAVASLLRLLSQDPLLSCVSSAFSSQGSLSLNIGPSQIVHSDFISRSLI